MKMTSNVLLKCHSFICAQKYSRTAFFISSCYYLACRTNSHGFTCAYFITKLLSPLLFHTNSFNSLTVLWLSIFILESFFSFFMSSNYEGIVKRRRERNAILRLLNKFQSDFCSWHDWFAININIALKLRFLLNDHSYTKKSRPESSQWHFLIHLRFPCNQRDFLGFRLINLFVFFLLN